MEIIYVNLQSKAGQALKPYLTKRGKTLVCAQRPLPSEEEIPFYESIGNGMFYAIGEFDRWGDTWKALDARIVKPITNEEIEEKVREFVKEETGGTLEEWLEENPEYGVPEIAWDILKLPYYDTDQ